MGLREDRFERVTQLFYEAAGAPDTWPEALEALAEASGATGAVLLPVRPGPPRAISSPGISDLIERTVSGGHHPSNPRMRRGMELTEAGWSGLITDRDMFGEEGLPPSDYAALLERHGFGWFAGMVLARVGHELVIPVSIERRFEEGPFTAKEVASLNRLMDQLRPAAALALRVGMAGATAFADGVAAMGEDAVVVGDYGNVLYATSGFSRHLGTAFALDGSRLTAIDPEGEHRLAALLARASNSCPAAGGLGRGLVLPRRGSLPLFIRSAPMACGHHEVFNPARAVIIVTDPERDGSQTFHILIETFRLSAAEARLARRIGRGETISDIANAEGMSVATMRQRLKSVFVKTGTHRQAELALLVASMSHRG
jgi:DNA-binding CsgD family transcriptional regulator